MPRPPAPMTKYCPECKGRTARVKRPCDMRVQHTFFRCDSCEKEWTSRQALPESQVRPGPRTEADRLKAKGFAEVPGWDELAAKMPPLGA